MEITSSSNKQKDILVAARDLFWKYGVKRVTTEEICGVAKVSKMTFYKYFPNKLELAKQLLSEITDSSIRKFNQIVASNVPFSEKLEGIFLMKIEAVNNISKEFLNDIYLNPELGLLTFLNEKTAEVRTEIESFYKNAQSQGHIRKDVNIDFVMEYSAQMVHLLEKESLMSQYKTSADFILEIMNLLFYGIVNKS